MAHHYKRVYQELKQQIEAGAFAVGDLLPTEKDLVEKYGFARVTIRQALSELTRENLISRVKGKGSIVASTRPRLELLSVKGFSEALGEIKLPMSTLFLKTPSVLSFPNPFFFPLSDEEKSESCLYIERVRIADQKPIMLEYTYLPLSKVPDFSRAALIEKGLFSALRENHDVVIVGLEQDLRAIEADDDTAFLLKIKPKSPILHIYRRYRTNILDFYVYSSLFCSTEKFAIGNAW